MNTTLLLAFMMPGPMELGVIAIVALLLFGGRLPKVARDVGGAMFELRRGISEAFTEAEEFEAKCSELDKPKKKSTA